MIASDYRCRHTALFANQALRCLGIAPSRPYDSNPMTSKIRNKGYIGNER